MKLKEIIHGNKKESDEKFRESSGSLTSAFLLGAILVIPAIVEKCSNMNYAHPVQTIDSIQYNQDKIINPLQDYDITRYFQQNQDTTNYSAKNIKHLGNKL